MRRLLGAALVVICGLIWATAVQADPPRPAKKKLIDQVCNLIETHADQNGLPRDFFARLIWKESRFDPNAVSPVGAEGIAQFMPGTAKMRGLANSFDIEQAIPASAKYLAEMKSGFGNLGLAAAAYNAGESRVTRWLNSGGFLPLETESYVLDVMGEPADKFTDAAYAGVIRPLDKKASFAAACRELPVIMSRTVPMSSINIKPWGVQVAGNFRRAAALNQWLRVKSRFPALLAGHDPVVSRVRTPIGRRGIYAVRIGADSRAKADTICDKLQSVGGACIVVRNR
ncbi:MULTISPECIES: lytic transglycosylase domain-containing protein [unclassified Mesorhizobium]|uniref:lytic transglycosylase domain-containing protein n=1 Tax=unclassified Mesorhizobium TaxID=325217 RepID=UPI00333C5CBD